MTPLFEWVHAEAVEIESAGARSRVASVDSLRDDVVVCSASRNVAMTGT